MKKRGFLTFLLALIPGCGLMYLGYMKKGLQIMGMFAASCYLAFVFSNQYYLNWFTAAFLAPLPVLWFYQMFDSMHSVARMKRQDIEFPSDDGFFVPDKIYSFSPAKNSTVAKVIAVMLIIAGCLGLAFAVLDNLRFVINQEAAEHIVRAIRNYLTPVLVSIAFIAAGIKLLKGNKSKTAGGAHDVFDGGEG